jgi:chromosome segregation ATPase
MAVGVAPLTSPQIPVNATAAAQPKPKPARTPKTYTHWSEYVLIAGAVVAVIAAVAAAALGIYVLTAACGILFATDLIGLHYIRQFMPMADIEASTDALKVQIKTMKARQTALENINQKIVDDNKQLATTTTGLKQEQTQDQSARLDLTNKLAASMKQFSEQEAKLKEAQDKLSSLTQLHAQWQAEANKINDSVQQFITANGQATKNSEAISKQVELLKAQSAQLHSSTDQIDKDAIQLVDLKKSIAQLTAQFEGLKALCTAGAKERDVLAKELQNLNEIVSKLLQSTQNMQHTSDTIGTDTHKLMVAVEIDDKRLDAEISQLLNPN